MDVLMPQLGETVVGRQGHHLVQIGRRQGPGRRQPVRDRNRQSHDGDPGDRRRRALRDPRASRGGRAGRRGCRDHRRRHRPTGRTAAAGAQPGQAAAAPAKPAPALAAPRIRTRADQARSLFRGTDAGEELGPARTAGGESSRRSPAALPPRPALICQGQGLRPARPHRRGRHQGRAGSSRLRRAAGHADGPSAAEIRALYKDTPFEEIPLDGMRQTIAARLLQAKQTIPHFYIVDDVNIGALMALREQLNAAAPTTEEAKPGLRSFRSTISSSRRGRRRCSRAGGKRRLGRGSHPPTSRGPTSRSLSRSKAA